MSVVPPPRPAEHYSYNREEAASYEKRVGPGEPGSGQEQPWTGRHRSPAIRDRQSELICASEEQCAVQTRPPAMHRCSPPLTAAAGPLGDDTLPPQVLPEATGERTSAAPSDSERWRWRK